MALEQYETFSAQERSTFIGVTADKWQNEEWEKTKKCSNCGKHICLLSQLAYSSIICVVKWIFQLRRQAATGPHVQGKSSMNVFSSLKSSSWA